MTLMETIIHPIRIRIIQYAAGRETFMVSDLSDNMPDVPKATLYRHVGALVENNVLQVANQFKVRGTVQYEYVLNRDSIVPNHEGIDAELQTNVYGILGMLMEDFRIYFSSPKATPLEDRLFLSINSLYLDDTAFERFIEEVFAVVTRYTKQPSPKGKGRMITVVSSPARKENKLKEEP